MKKLSTYLFLILFIFQTPSQADDIRNFQIEGMSIGDSLLKFVDKNTIFSSRKYTYKDNEFYTLDVLLSQVPLTRIYLAFIVIGARFVRGAALKSDTSAWTRGPQRNTFR